MKEKNIIIIRKEDVQEANKAFSELMKKTESILNEDSINNSDKYKGMLPSVLEEIAASKIKEACIGTPFDEKNVKLVSGQSFPDIISDIYYGVEVKSTKNNSWVSTGSSIMESTRDKNVENIYMLFGNLGANPPQFKSRPYQDVLYDIAVTHSPRYLINMEIAEKQTIFYKMGTDYDTFRKSADSIGIVRKYYRRQAEENGKSEMPWWMTQNNVDEGKNFNVRLWNTLSKEEKDDLIAKSLILFPETMSPQHSQTKYNQVSLWLCTYCQIVSPNIRDAFSAGGKIISVNGEKLSEPIPQIFNRIVLHADQIKNILTNDDKEMKEMICEFYPEMASSSNMYDFWLNKCINIADLYNVSIEEWITNKPKFEFSKK